MKPKYLSARFFPSLILAGGLVTLGIQFAEATPYYWNTTTTGVWSTGSNWSDNATSGGTSGTAPTSSDTVTFNQSATNGNETVNLSGATSIAGITFANTGTTLIQSDTSATARVLTLANGITVNAGAGAVTLGGATTFVTSVSLNGAQSWTNNSTVGTLSVAGTAASTGINAGANLLTLSGAGNFSLQAFYSTVGFTHNGSGTLLMSQSNSTLATGISGAINIGAGGGTLALGTSSLSSANNSTLQINGGTITASTSSARSVAMVTTIAGDFTMGQASTGTGVLTFSNAMSLGSVARKITVANASDIISGVISNSGGGLTKAGVGALTLSGANTYTGTTTINAGILQANIADVTSTSGALGNGGAITFTGGTLQYTANSAGTDYSMGGRIKNSTSAMILDDAGQTVALAGALDSTNVAGLSKSTGVGTLTLSGSNGYTGLTTVGAGTLKLGSSTALGATGVGNTTSITAGAALDLNGQSSAEDVSLNGTGLSLAGALFNNSGTTSTLSGTITVATDNASIGGTGNITLSSALAGGKLLSKVGTGTLTLQAAATRSGSTASVTTIDGGVIRLESATGLSSTTSVQTNVNSTGVLELGLAGGSTAITHNQLVTLNNGGTLRSDGSNTDNSTITIAASASATISTKNAADVFTVGNATNDLTGGASATLSIAGSGAVRFSQASNYAGNWSLSSGTTQLGDAAALGATPASTITLAGGATLSGRKTTDTVFTANPITVSGTGTATLMSDVAGGGSGVKYTFGALSIGSQTLAATNGSTSVSGANVTGSPSIAVGAVTLTNSPTFNVSPAGNATSMTLTLGAIDDGVSTFGFTKTGTGTLVLGGAGTYDGTTTINGGILQANNATNALGTGNITFGGGTLQYTTITAGVDYSTGGRIKNSGSAISLDDNAQTIALAGLIDTTNTAGLTKSGSGTLTLSGANTYTGTNTVSTGTLKLGNATALGAAANALTINSSTGTTTLDLNGNNATVGLLTLGGAASSTSVVTSGSSTLTLGGNVVYDATNSPNGATIGTATTGILALGSSAHTFTVGDSSGVTDDLTITGKISGTAGAGITKAGAGTLTLSNSSNPLVAAWIVNAGTLRSIASTANAFGDSTASTLLMNAGRLELVSASDRAFKPAVTVAGNVTVMTDRSVSATGAGTTHSFTSLSIGSQTLTVEGGAVANNAASTGSQGLTFGTTTLTGNAAFNVDDGVSASGAVVTLNLGAIGGSAGNGIAKSGSGILNLTGANTYTGSTDIQSGSVVLTGSLSSSTSLNLGNGSNSGKLVLGSSTAAVNTTVAGLSTTGTGTSNAVVGCNSTASTLTLNLSSGSNTYAGTLGGSGTNENSLALTKSGAGSLTLSGTNTYSGATAITAGTLQISAANQIGNSSATNTISLGAGTLRSTSGTYSLGTNRAITLTGAGTLQSDADTLTVDGSITNSTYLLTVAGAGNTTVSGVIGSGSGGLSKSGAGVLTLSNANSYTGGTTITAGTLNANNASALGTGTVTLSGGTLGIGAAITNIIASSGSGGTIQINQDGSLSASSIGSNALSLAGAASHLASFTNSKSTGTLSTTGPITLGGYSNITLTDATNKITSSSGAVTLSGTNNTLTLGGSSSFGDYLLLSGSSAVSGDSISITGAGVGNQTIALGSSATVGRTIYAFSVDNVNKGLNLNVGGGAWTNTWSNGSGTWDTSGTSNWLKDNAGSAIAYYAGDNAVISTADTITVAAGGVSAGTVTVNNTSGTATLAGADGTATLSAVSLSKSGAGALTTTNALNLSGALSVSAGTANLNAANTITGGVNVTGGTLALGAAGGAGSGTVTLNGGTLAAGNGLTVSNAIALGASGGTVGAASGDFTLGGVISGANALNKTGANTVTLSGTNTYSGATNINAGTLKAGASTALSAGAINIGAAGTLDVGTYNATTTGAVVMASGGTLAGSTGSLSAASFSSNGGTIGVTLKGVNAFTAATGTTTLNGSNTYSGATSVSSGATLKLGSATALGSTTGNTTVASGTLDLNGQTVGAESLSITAINSSTAALTNSSSSAASLSGNVVLGSTNTTIAPGAGGITLSGVLSNSSSTRGPNIIGGGTLTLSGSNTYNGLTTIAAGTLVVNSGSNYSSSASSGLSIGTNGSTPGYLSMQTAGAYGTNALTIINANLVGPSTGIATLTAATASMSGSSSKIMSVDAHSAFVLSGGLDLIGAGTASRSLTVTNEGAATFNGSISQGSSGSIGSFIKAGSGTASFNAVNSYTGLTTVSAGELDLNATGGLSIAGNLTVDGSTAVVKLLQNNQVASTASLVVSSGGIFDLNGSTQTVAGVSISGTGSQIIGGTLTSTTNFDLQKGTIGAPLAGSVAFTKTSGSLVTLNGVNTYTGATNINDGSVTVSSTGSINGSSGVNVAAGGKLSYNSSTALTSPLTMNGSGGVQAVLAGSGTINSSLTLNSVDDVIAPGNSPGTLSFAQNQTWNSFTYSWQLGNSTGTTAGIDYDSIGITGALDLTGTAGSYVLDMLSLTGNSGSGGLLAETGGALAMNRSWNIITTSGGISNFDASAWTINTTGFTASSASFDSSNFALGVSGNNLVLTYVPEPDAAMLVGSLGVLALLRRRRF